MKKNYSLKLSILSLIIMMLFGNMSVNAQTPIVKWSFSSIVAADGFGASPLAPATNDENLTVVGLTRHWNVNLSGVTPAGSGWGGNNFSTTATTAAAAIAANNYVTFSITAETGYELSLSSIGAYNIRRTATGPSTGQWQYSLGGSFVDIGTPITWGAPPGTAANGIPQSAISLLGITDLQNVSAGTTVTFRLLLWGATNTGGTLYFNDAGNSGAPGLPVFGTVAESGAPMKVATPTFNPIAGTYTSTQSVVINCETEGATIYYTTDGSTPTTGSSVFSTPINVVSDTTIKAMATAAGMDNSIVAIAEYVINLTPVPEPLIAWDFTGVGGGTTPLSEFEATTYDEDLTSEANYKNITRGPGATWSTGNNSFRTTGFGSTPIAVTKTAYFQVTVKPAEGKAVSLSSVSGLAAGTATFAATPGVSTQFAYSLDGSTFTLIGSPFVEIGTPQTFEFDLSSVEALQNVPGVIYLRYYAQGQTGTGGWGFNSFPAGTNGLAIYGSIETATVSQVAKPTFTPPQGTFTSSINVTITTPTQGATIHYTTDGTTPTTTSPTYNNPIPVTTTTTIKAIAVKAGMTPSDVETATYTIIPLEIPNVVISGVYTGGGSAGALFNSRYVELYNTTDADIDLSGFGLYYIFFSSTSASAANRFVFPQGSTIGAKKFALVKAAGGASGAAWPAELFDFDASGTGTNFNMAIGAGKVLLLSAAPNLSNEGSVPTTLAGIQTMPNYMDYLPYGTAAVPTFNTTQIPNLATTTAAKRIYNEGTKEIAYTFEVGNDFEVVSPITVTTPRNSKYGMVQVLVPTFTPAEGTYNSPINVTITTATESANIFYTTDGTNPTTSSTPYTTPIALEENGTYTIKAIAVKDGMLDSEVADATFVINIFEPFECDFLEDFEDAAWLGTNYTPRNVTVSGRAWIVSGVGTMDANDRRNGDRSIRLRGNTGDNCRVEMNFDKPDGIGFVSFAYASYSTHSNGQISLHYSTNQGATWTSAGSVIAPAWGGEMLTANFTLNIEGYVRIKVVRDGALANSTSVNIDDICLTNFGDPPSSVATPYFDPAEGTFVTAQNIEIKCATEGASIFYTTDGTNPTAASIPYTVPVALEENGTYTIKAIAVKAGMESSEITTGTFIIDIPEAPDCDLLEDFEAAAWAGTNYTPRVVTVDGNEWRVAGIGTMDANDRRNGARSIRLRGNMLADTIPANLNRVEMLFDKPNGLGTVSFAYASYSSHSGGIIYLDYSIDGGSTWINVGSTPPAPTWANGGSAMLNATFDVNVPGDARIRISKRAQDGSRSVNIDDICINDYTGPVTVAIPTFTPPGGNCLTTQNVVISSTTLNATIYYTLDGSDPSETSWVYATPIPVNTTTTIKAMATKAGMENSGIATAIYSFPIEVPNIAAFKAANTPAATTHRYKITGDVTFVFRNGRNIYIKDATGGLLIFDNSPSTITTTYNNGDVISGGVIGTCTIYNGLFELIPVANTAAGTPGAPVQPTPVTMANLLANFAAYESQLIKLEEVAFAGGTFGTGAAGNIDIFQGDSEMICRNHYNTITGFETDPATRYDVAGFAIPFNADRQIAPRDVDDINKTKYTVTLSSSPAGAGTLTGAGTYHYNDPVTINATPGAAYNFVNWTEGAETITQNPYSFNITENRTFTANFQMKTYTITSSVNGVGGTIAPLGTTTVNHGATPTYTITPSTGYEIDQVLVNGSPVTVSSGTYTFQPVTANQTIVASFKLRQFTLTFNPNTGTVNPTSKQVTYSLPVGTLPVPVKTNCNFLGWFIGNTEITAATIWTYTSNQTATARWEYPIFVTNLNPTLGTVTPAGAVNYYLSGQNATYTFSPNTGAHITSVVIDEVTVFEGNSEVTAIFSHTFTNIQDYHTITVGFATNCYEMNPNNIIGAATVTMEPEGCITHGSDVTFTISADCHTYEVWFGEAYMGAYNQGGINNESFTHTITATEPLPLITVLTTMKQYTVMATPSQFESPMNYITPGGASLVNCGGSRMYDFITELGYRVSALFVDDEQVSVPTTIRRYNLENILFDRTIHVEFEEFPQYTIQFGPRAAQNLGGVVYPTIPYEESGEIVEFYITVDSGTFVYPFTIKADDGFEIDKVYVDNVIVNVTGISTATYEFFDLDANHTLIATFKPIMYTITATAGLNGNINPSGAVQVVWGTNQTFNIIPNTGYKVSDVVVDGESKGAISTYTFENVKANGTIHATFTRIIYEITTAVTGGSGHIVPAANPILVPHGDNVTLTFVPAQGYRISTVLINNIPNPAAVLTGTYTFTNVTQNHDVEVTFAKLTFTITATATSGGIINPQGTTTVEYGANSPTYLFIPDPGFYIKSVLVNGVVNNEATQNGMHRFFNVTANQTLHVIFAVENFTIMAVATPGGSITPSGAVTVQGGASRRFDFVAQQGFKLARVMINEINNPEAVTNGYHIFTNVLANQTIFAIFERMTYTVTLPNVPGAIITTSQSTIVAHGSRFVFTVTLEDSHNQSTPTVRANGIKIIPTTGGVYTINNVMSDQTITIDDVNLNQYRITARAFAGGTMNPDGIFMVTHGADQTFTFTPNPNFEIDRVTVDGKDVELDEDNTYTLKNITANTVVEAFFKREVGIIENELNIKIFSYTNVVTIRNENLVPVKQVEIMDMFGRVVWTGKANKKTTEITLHVAAGIYAVRVITDDNQQIIRKVSIN